MTATKPLPPHGTTDAARRAHENALARHRTRLKAYGRWNPWVDADPIRAHIASLADYGIGWKRAAELAGLSTTTVSSWVYGHRGGPPPAVVRAALAAKMLAVKPILDNAAAGGRIDATGTRRRLQALIAVGWPMKHLAIRLGMSPSNSHQLLRRVRVEAATARAVRMLFRQLWDVRPETAGVPFPMASRSRKIAVRKGWPPPLAWIDIDDPDEVPDGWLRAGRRSVQELVEDAEEIRRTCGIDWDLVAERLGVRRSTLDRARERAKSRAKAGGA